MLRESKKSSLYCGGSSHVFRMENIVKKPTISRLFDEDALLVGFPDSIVRILSVLTDPTVSDGWIEEKLREFHSNVMAVRGSLKQNQVMESHVKKMMKETASKRLKPRKSQGPQ
jgi:hypothetical protein